MFHLAREQFVLILLIFIFFIISCLPNNQQTSLVTREKEENFIVPNQGVILNEVPINRIDIIKLESFPIYVNVVAQGNLPNNCTIIDQITEQKNGNTLTVKMTMTHQTNKVCTKVTKPFEEIIPLNVTGLSAGIYTVKINSIVDTFELNVDNIIP